MLFTFYFQASVLMFVKQILYQEIKTHQSERMSLFISPHVNQHHQSSSSSATDSLVARVHTQLYRSIESNRKICRLQLGHLSIRKTTETMKPKSSPPPLQDKELGLGRSKPEWTGDTLSSPGTLWGLVRLRWPAVYCFRPTAGSWPTPGLELDSRPPSTQVFSIILRGVNPSLQLCSTWSHHANKLWDSSTRLRC